MTWGLLAGPPTATDAPGKARRCRGACCEGLCLSCRAERVELVLCPILAQRLL